MKLVKQPLIAVIIPCFQVGKAILRVVSEIGPEVSRIYLVDDACPNGAAQFLKLQDMDPRLTVIKHENNRGGGAETITGMQAAIREGADILVKLDGDGQMSPAMIPRLVKPLIRGKADYTKGNRFIYRETMFKMPAKRYVGNILTSLCTKLSSGYWSVFDATNGFVAIHANVFDRLPHDRISNRFFFETDMLHHLYMMGAVVEEIPVPAIYGDETSNLTLTRNFLPFVFGHIRNFVRRLTEIYFVRDFSVFSLLVIFGVLFLLFGIGFGANAWLESIASNTPATAGTVMLAGLPVFVGIQMLVGFLLHDSNREPAKPVHQYDLQSAWETSHLQDMITKA